MTSDRVVPPARQGLEQPARPQVLADRSRAATGYIVRHCCGVERAVVVGCAGSGKSTLARKLAVRTGLPLVERDELGVPGSPQYLQAIAEMAGRPRWILDGAPYYADGLAYPAADTVIFLDYAKPVVMWRVLRRTLVIELLRRPAGAHRPQGRAAWRDASHPVRWA